MGIREWWASREEEKRIKAEEAEANKKAEKIKVIEIAKAHIEMEEARIGRQRADDYKEKEKYYLQTYHDKQWGDRSRISFSSVEATNIFYRILAEQGKAESTVKILASQKDLKALSMDEFGDQPIGVMAVKNFNLSLLFRNKAEKESDDGRAVLKVTREWAKKLPRFGDNLQIGIMSNEDFYKLEKRNIVAFTAANVSSDVEAYMHAFKIQRCQTPDGDGGVDEGRQVADFFSLEKDGKFSGAVVDREFTSLLSRAQPITLDNM